jgi:hypothetical protein
MCLYKNTIGNYLLVQNVLFLKYFLSRGLWQICFNYVTIKKIPIFLSFPPSYKTRPSPAGRPGTDPSLIKDWPGQQPGKTQSTRWLDRSEFNKRLAGATARQNPVDRRVNP